MDGVILTPLKRINHPKGDIFHAMKKSDNGFAGFGEAYFSTIHKDDIKGWKKHTRMVLNLVVPVGTIEFILYNEDSKDFLSIELSPENYQRLTVQPNIWMAFRGKDENNLLLNLASIEHQAEEAMKLDINEIEYAW